MRRRSLAGEASRLSRLARRRLPAVRVRHGATAVRLAAGGHGTLVLGCKNDDRYLPCRHPPVLVVAVIQIDDVAPEALSLFALGFSGNHGLRIRADLDLGVGLGAEVEPPLRVSVRAAVRGDDHYVLAI